MYTECSGSLWRSIARHLRKTAAWQPIYWTGAEADRAAVKAAFPETIFHVGVDAAKGIAATEAADWPRPALDAALLRALAPAESVALQMMDRMDPDGRSFSHDERRRHYYDLLRYWTAALGRLGPDLVIFSISPHIVYDFVLYELCKELGVATVMFERTALSGLVFPMARFETGSEALRSAYQRTRAAATVALSPAAADHLAQLSAGDAAELPKNYRKKLARFGMLGLGGRQQDKSLLAAYAFEARRFLGLAWTGGPRRAPPNYLKLPGRAVAESHLGLLRWQRLRLRALARKRRLLRLYRRLARPADSSRPFVFLALHYQPERATLPMAGSLGDQTLIVDMLAKNLPPGWLLYVKEHPWQLQPYARGEMARDPSFYHRICAHPQVRLLPLESDSSALIGAARAVATATGSIGWQALGRGVPALVFGAAWYRDCAGVYWVESAADCRRALAEIADGARVPDGELRAFLAAVEQITVPGYLEPDLEAVDGLSEDTAAEAMAAALKAWRMMDIAPVEATG